MSNDQGAQGGDGGVAGLEQRVAELSAAVEAQQEQLAAAEAQRDEARSQVTATQNRLSAQRLLVASGAVDIEAAMALLEKRIDLGGEVDDETVARTIQGLLLDKPFLRGAAGGSLPPVSAATRPAQSLQQRMLDTAQRAITSGNRRDVIDYLRLRRAAGRRK